MPSPLNRVPPGLLDFFGIKSGEWGPRELGQTLLPTFELGRWYLDANALEVACSFAAGGILAADAPVGGIAFTATVPPLNLITGGQIVVPQNETWIVLEASTTLDFSAVASQFGDAQWYSRGLPLPMRVQGFTTSDAALARRYTATLERPFWSRPGDPLAVFSNGIEVAASTVALQARLRVVRFLV